jgi:hypothetical protein
MRLLSGWSRAFPSLPRTWFHVAHDLYAILKLGDDYVSRNDQSRTS